MVYPNPASEELRRRAPQKEGDRHDLHEANFPVIVGQLTDVDACLVQREKNVAPHQ